MIEARNLMTGKTEYLNPATIKTMIKVEVPDHVRDNMYTDLRYKTPFKITFIGDDKEIVYAIDEDTL